MEKDITQTVKETIQNYSLIKRGEKVLIGVSGGPDSMALLNILFKLKEELSFEIAVATFNHMIRRESNSEVRFVEKFAKNLGIRFFKGKANVKQISSETKRSIEDTAREERFKFLFKIKEQEGFDKIALGHNLDDLTETMLINIFKGCGVSGIVGIKPLSFDGIIHPIIYIERKEIEEYLTENNIPYKTDFSNFSLCYLRNKIRYQVIPLIESIFPEAKKQLLHLSLITMEEDNFIDPIAKEELGMVKNNDHYSLVLVKRLPVALKRRVIKDILEEEANFDRVERFINFLESSKRRINIAQDIFIEKDLSSFWFERKSPFSIKHESTINIPGDTLIEEAGVKIKTYIASELPQLNNFKVAFDLDKLKLPLKIRFRKEGDTIRLENGIKKLQDLFVDMKIRKDRRYKTPILVDGNDEILWVVGVRRSSISKIEKDIKNKVILEANFNKN